MLSARTIHRIAPQQVWRRANHCENDGENGEGQRPEQQLHLSSIEQLEDIMIYCSSYGGEKAPMDGVTKGTMVGLRGAIDRFNRRYVLDFVKDVAPSVVSWTRDFTVYPSPPETSSAVDHSCIQDAILALPRLCTGTSSSVSLSSVQARSVLANIFLLNVRDSLNDGFELPHMKGYTKEEVRILCSMCYGQASFARMYRLDDEVAIQRVLCLLAYFYCEWKEQCAENSSQDSSRDIVFERIHRTESELLSLSEWSSSVAPLVPSRHISVHKGLMEEGSIALQRAPAPPSSFSSTSELRAANFVDFANQRVHIHQVIASATQEEILFNCCPELFIALLLYGILTDQESAVVRNVRRYTHYEGYLDSFRFTGIYGMEEDNAHAVPLSHSKDDLKMNRPSLSIVHPCVLVMDACYSDHFSTAHLQRDLNKGMLPFSAVLGLEEADRRRGIATGPWGCGVFGGDKTHKMLQQLCALAQSIFNMNNTTDNNDTEVCAGPLIYSESSSDLRERWENILNQMEKDKYTVGQVVQLMIAFKESSQRPQHFLPFVEQQLQ